MKLETIKALIEHGRTAPDDESEIAFDLARAAIRREKLESLATLVESHVEELHALDKVRMLVAFSVTSGQSTPVTRRLHELLNTKPAFNPKAGIRAAIPCFEWAQKHGQEIHDLLAKI